MYYDPPENIGSRLEESPAGEFVLSTGRKIKSHNDYVSIAESAGPCFGRKNESPPGDLTYAERAEITGYAIAIWLKWMQCGGKPSESTILATDSYHLTTGKTATVDFYVESDTSGTPYVRFLVRDHESLTGNERLEITVKVRAKIFSLLGETRPDAAA